uniref:glycoside hydrolase family 2 TIM barrel-domain containing protein n=1 Tax=Paenibacillus glycinis TaxID=2697035 RepID=UPI002E2DA194|nr:glycoside hydrolase family 2 TIM barrel-domain containing protein [Paenibacillus glycinis]
MYRHVWLRSTDPLHVADHGTYVTTPDIAADGSNAVVAVAANVRNESDRARRFRVRTSLHPKAGGDALAATLSETVALSPYSATEINQRLTLAFPALWTPEQPNLYLAVSAVEEILDREEGRSATKPDAASADPAAMAAERSDASEDADERRDRSFEPGDAESHEGVRLADRYETVFGVRSIAFAAERGFLLNGKPYPIRGTSNHQDFAGVGVALPDALIAYKLKLLKEMGCNAYRSAHHPPTPELLALCDELGLLVMNENRKLDSTPRGLDHLRRMILRDRNHPCIILWSLENEEVLEGTATGSRILKRMAGEARRLDPARPTSAAMNHGWHEGDYADQVDVVGYNYGHRGSAADGRRRFPRRAQIGSESASYTTTRGEYADDPASGYASAYGTSIPSWGCSPAVSWQAVLDDPSLTGVFLWTGFDYRGEPTPYEWPCINSHFGIMDTCGFPKDVYYEVQAMWTPEPLVHVMPHWNWAGREGEEIEIWTYGNCDSVELWLNGRLLGEQAREGLSPIKWAVPYERGTLRAIGKNGGVRAASAERATAGAASRIVLEADRTRLGGDGTDVAVLRVSVVDAEGRIVPTADSLIRFELSGPASVLGVGNGNPSSHEPDKADRRRAFNGRCLALIQPSELHGESSATIRVKAISSGLVPAELILTAAAAAGARS